MCNGVKPLELTIIQDPEPHNPRDWSNLSRMVTDIRGYTFGLGDDLELRDTITAWAEEHPDLEGALILPCRYRDSRYNGELEMGAVGDAIDEHTNVLFYVTADRIREEYGADTAESREIAGRGLKGEAETMAWYIAGEVWGFDTGDDRVNTSVWGFFGTKKEDVLGAMAENLSDSYLPLLNAAWNDRTDYHTWAKS